MNADKGNYNGLVHPNWPFRWPEEWRDPNALELLRETPIGYLLMPSAGDYGSVVERARQIGITVCDGKTPPADVEMVKAEWPGIRMSEGGSDATGGPTGAPWIDSNGWLARLTRVRKPGRTVWLAAEAPKKNEIMPWPRHLVAVADGAAHGGRWVVTLDRDMAAGLAARQPAMVQGWRKLMDALAFFQAHEEWSTWPVDAALGVVSTFAGENEFFSQEVLNLTARTNVSYRIITVGEARPEALRGLRAVLYTDGQPPPAAVRQALLDFAERGGLLIVGPKWGAAPGSVATEETHPRYEMRRFGKGRIAMAFKQPEDPFEVAQDAQILVSHRYDRVRFFNGFLLGSYSTVSPDGKRSLTHVINYAGGADDPPTVRIAGERRRAKLWWFERAEAPRVEAVEQQGGVEVHLPRFDVYVGVEMGA